MQSNVRKSLITITAFGIALSGSSVFAADSAAGMATYSSKCKTCHAADGNGNPGMAKALKVEFKPLSGAEVQGLSDADLKAVVTNGKGKMHAVAGVAGADLDNVVAYIRSMKK
jgi:mono/diheme cytochrome c family protein